MDKHPVGAEWFHADRQADRRTDGWTDERTDGRTYGQTDITNIIKVACAIVRAPNKR
jgi:hypothetical protein